MERELEVKVLNMDYKVLEQKIIDLGGKLIAKEVQVNTLIDSSERPVKESTNGYLRLRETKDLLKDKINYTLTLKKIVDVNGLRENMEFNSEVLEKESLLTIFNELGYDLLEEGYKDRTSYELNGGRFDFDKWDVKTYPYPYMEIEVESYEKLEELVKLLDIPKENISTKSILELRKELL